ncbi:MAG: virulence RhuM family protein [Bacteroidales bacterium]|nr:virulence RhuM family protein [Bacteroidales bacterium]
MSISQIPYDINNNVVVYCSDDNTLQLAVQISDETVWLTQQQMVALFDTTKPNVSMHIRNVYNEGELEESATVKDFLTVQKEGGRQVSRRVRYYNLDVIISVGYRVKSKRGTQFRQWANRVLKDYLLKGYAVNQQLLYVEQRLDNRLMEHEKRLDNVEQKIDFFVRTNALPVEQVFFDGQFFDARVLLEKLIKTAAQRVVIIDAYVDAATFEILDVRNAGVTADIYSGKDLTALRNIHNSAANVEPIDTHIWTTPSHDRWLIVDNNLYHCGHSLKDIGRKLSAITLMGTLPETVLNAVR